jgi:hypothetical protein
MYTYRNGLGVTSRPPRARLRVGPDSDPSPILVLVDSLPDHT